jgi:hypothetical protein
MRVQGWFTTVTVACLFWLISWVIAPAAFAFVQVELSDLSYHECSSKFSEGLVTPGSTQAADCYIITGKAINKSGKPVINADIFGRIYDANHNPVFQNRTRLGAIDEVPPGVSDFEVRITVSANQPTPLQLEQFKASGFTGKVRR